MDQTFAFDSEDDLMQPEGQGDATKQGNAEGVKEGAEEGAEGGAEGGAEEGASSEGGSAGDDGAVVILAQLSRIERDVMDMASRTSTSAAVTVVSACLMGLLSLVVASIGALRCGCAA